VNTVMNFWVPYCLISGVTNDFLKNVLHHGVRSLETNVSEAVPPPSSGLSFLIMEMYPPHCCLPRELLNAHRVFMAENRSRTSDYAP
jgi:hypothetical protein